MFRRKSRSLSVGRVLPAILLLLTAYCPLPAAFAQSATATLSGAVLDEKGAVIAGVSVTIINNATSLKRQTTTGAEGSFVLPLLPPGAYTVTFERAGFASVKIPDVVLNVGDQRALQIQLKVGQVGATVNVTAEAPLINESPSVGTLVDRQFVENIPLNGRTLQSLIALTPGIVFTGNPPGVGSGGTGQFSVNGQRSDGNSFMVDGVSANFGTAPGSFLGSQVAGNIGGTTALGTTQSLASLDAIQEFRIQTSTYAAEFGRQPGAQISIVTRSGTNSFHGLLFEYLRNDKFDANDWFANSNHQPRPPERQNDFGGTFGGPILIPRLYDGHNKTFFFFSYEGLRLRLPNFALTNVPTLCLRGKGSCGPGQVAAPAGLQPILNAFPTPNGKDLGNGFAEFTSAYTNPSTLNATSIRIDHALTQSWNIFGRYNDAPSEQGVRQTLDLALLRINRQHARTYTFGLNGALSARSANEFRFNYTTNTAKTPFQFDQGHLFGATPLEISDILPKQFVTPTSNTDIVFQFPGMTAPSFGTQFALFNGITQDQNLINVTDNFSFTIGVHRLKFGFDWRRVNPFTETNTYRVDAQFLSLQSLLNNTSDAGSIFASNPLHPLFINFSVFAQDSWKVTPRLNLDLGLRWDVNPSPSEGNGIVPLAVDQVSNLATMQLMPYGTKQWGTTYGNFAPRFGVAYQLSQRPGRETVVRGGVGIFFDTGNAQGATGIGGGSFRYPFTLIVSKPGLSYPLSPAVVAPPALPDPKNLIPPYGSTAVFDPNLALPYTLQWSVAIQQSLGKDQALTLTYLGNSGRRLLQQRQIDLTGINPKFTIIGLTTNRATSDYNALQAQFQRRLSRGLQALASYTWSHALDEDSVDSGFLVAVRGNSFYDVRHNFSAALTYDIPVRSRSQAVNAVFGAWSIDTSFFARSGLPIDLIASQVVNPADGNLTGQRPNIVAGQPLYIYDPTLPGGRKINRAAFTIPAAGQFGNLGRNVVRALGIWEQDLALHRQFKLTEKVGLQFRAEAFNIYNHPNFGTYQTSLSAANFGQATAMLNQALAGGGSAGKLSPLYAVGGPRSMQFALRLSF